MIRRSEFRLVLLALAAASAPALAEPASRSGLPPAAVPAAGVPAPPFRSAADRVFADGVDGAPAGSGPVTRYDDRAAFLAAVADGYAGHDFAEIAPGPSGLLTYEDGVDYDIDDPYADPPLTEPAPYWYQIFTGLFPSNPLYDGDGFLSTDRIGDPISVLTRIGEPPITAIGATIWTSDFGLQPVAGTLTVMLIMQDGNVDPVTFEVDATAGAAFVGFVAPIGQPIAGILVYADALDAPVPGESPDRWPTLDDLVVGSARP
ncbi:MAG TPA: hypothetical protein VGC30_13805 [Dokdonella sp.]